MSQTQQIKQHLSSGKSLTSLEALQLFGCLRLSARIFDLINQGMNIKKVMIEVGDNKQVAKYFV